MKRFPLLRRKKNTTKFDYGHVLVVAGSRGLAGAAVLCATAALRSGAGLVTLAVPSGLQAFISKKSPPELMVVGLSATKAMSFDSRALGEVNKLILKRNISCVALGPGLSVNPSTQKFSRRFVRESVAPVVLDGDGLNSFKGRAHELLKRKAPLVLTPHAGEFERVFSEPAPESYAAKKELAKKISTEYQAVLVLKGHRTLVADRNKIYLNSTGNAGMAKAGCGDVLTGIIAAFIAQGFSPYEAACWAVYFHGRAGDLAVADKGVLGLLASDIIEYLTLGFK